MTSSEFGLGSKNPDFLSIPPPFFFLLTIQRNFCFLRKTQNSEIKTGIEEKILSPFSNSNPPITVFDIQQSTCVFIDRNHLKSRDIFVI